MDIIIFAEAIKRIGLICSEFEKKHCGYSAISRIQEEITAMKY